MSESPRIKCVLLAAGLGSRLRPLTDSVPKCLVEIGGKPLIDWWMDGLVESRIREVLINTHHLRDAVSAHLKALRARGFDVTEAYEPELLGSAGTIAENRGFADDADVLVLVYADNLSNVDLRAVLDFHASHADPLTMVLFRTTRPSACGIAELDAEGRVVEFVEKPARPKSDQANAGIYVMSAAAYREIADLRAFDLGFDALPRFVGRMRGFRHEGYHRDIGDLEALEQARDDVRRGALVGR